jgi:hypothetical protein
MISLKVVACILATSIALPTAALAQGASKYTPGHEQRKPGQAKQFAPGHEQKRPGQAKQFAPGHEMKK